MSLEWIGAKKAVERTAPQAGANAGWRLADRCFGRGEKYGAFFEGEKSPAMQGQVPGGAWWIDVLGEVFMQE